jgi:hypothetical protein
MFKITIATLLATTALTAYAGTDGHTEVQSQTASANVPKTITAHYYTRYRSHGYGCHTATVKMYLDVAGQHAERKVNEEICPGDVKFHYTVQLTGVFPAGQYQIHSRENISALGENPEKYADAILTVN